MSQQNQWRYCHKCHLLFFDGYPGKGRCIGGGGHEAQGFDYSLPYSSSETASAQANWRYCQKCYSIYYDGFADKGVCAAGGPHRAQGLNFTLPHDGPENPHAQTSWRYCQKCHAMFYDGFPDKGLCPAVHRLTPAGPAHGGHEAAGFTFVLPHDVDGRPSVVHFHDTISFSGGTPVGGWLDVVIDSEGNTTCSGHLHDSGGVGYSYTVSAFLVSPDGIAIGGDLLGNQGTLGGTFDTHSRDDDWMKVGFGDRIKSEWDLHNFSASTFRWYIKVADDVSPTVVSLFNDALKSFATEAGKRIADIIFPDSKGS